MNENVSIYKKVLINNASGLKFVIIPSKSEIKPGDYVKIIRADNYG